MRQRCNAPHPRWKSSLLALNEALRSSRLALNESMNEWMNEWMNERIYEWTYNELIQVDISTSLFRGAESFAIKDSIFSPFFFFKPYKFASTFLRDLCFLFPLPTLSTGVFSSLFPLLFPTSAYRLSRIRSFFLSKRFYRAMLTTNYS